MAQFSPLDQINDAVKMSKQYKYLWCACQLLCLAQGPRLLIENFDFNLRMSLRSWAMNFPGCCEHEPYWYFHRKQRENWTKKSLELCSYSLPTIFFLATWNLSHSHAVCKWHVYVVVQFYPGFKFYFPLFQTHYHTLPYPKTKENKI